MRWILTQLRPVSNDRKIDKIVPIKRNDAHKMIEECMLVANVATAKFISASKVPSLYRVHEAPKTERLTNLRSYLSELGLELTGQDDPQPADYQKLAAFISDRADRHVIQVMMLRSMSQAVYSPEEDGHFGLAYAAYTHFTSPIRRYPDLLIHRAIRSQIHSDKMLKTITRPDGFTINPDYQYSYSIEQVLHLGEHCSMTERRADDATRDVMAWLKCEYMQAEVGNDYQGIVTAVTGFGLFVELKDVYIEGLIHITALPKDYYQFEAAKQRLVGERTRKTFRLGDQVSVKVVAVNLDDRKIDFELVATIASAKKSKSSAKLKAGDKKVAKPAQVKSSAIKESIDKSQPKARKRNSEKAKSMVATTVKEELANDEQYSEFASQAAVRPQRDAILNVDFVPQNPNDKEPKEKRVRKRKIKASGDKIKTHLSGAEKEIANLNKGAKGLSNRAKKRKAKKVLKKSIKRQQPAD